MKKSELLICNIHGISDFSFSGIKNPRWKCKKCMYDTSKKYLHALKIKCIEYKGGKCERCNYNKNMRSMHFHHIDPTIKEFSIGDRNAKTNKNGTKKWESIKIELQKCLLLCSNCHYELHDELDQIKEQPYLGLHRKQLNFFNTQILKGRKTPQQIMNELFK